MGPNCADALELGVRQTEYVNHAYVAGEETGPPEMQQEPPKVEASPEEKRRVIRNVVVLSVAFMCNFTTKYGAGNLQSSLNAAHGLGTASLAAMYGGLIISNATLPTIMIRWLGCRSTVVLTFLLLTPYIAFQYHTSFYSLVPASFLAGVVLAPLGVAANKYLAVTAEVYSGITGTPIDVVIPKFFGFFLLMSQGAQVWGNLITSAVITSNEALVNVTTKLRILETCGTEFCAGDSVLTNPNFRRPDDDTILLLVYIFVGAIAVSIVLVVFGVDSLKRYSKEERESSSSTGCPLLAVTFRQLISERPLQLLLPLTFWLGLEQAFLSADYTEAYVSCAWGLGDVGYVMVAHGVANGIFSLLIGWLVKLTGRLITVLIAFLAHVSIIATLLVWAPDPSQQVVYFVITVLWGAADAIWIVQIISLYGLLSPGNEEAAFSNYDLWLSMGFIVGFAYSSVLCTRLKVYIMLALLLLGMVAYLILEWRHHSQKRPRSPDTAKSNTAN